MKKKYIIILSIITIVIISYLCLFTGTKELPASKIVEKYDPFFNSLIMPITKYEQGFFSHTFYTQTIVDNKKYELRFKINYLNHTVTVQDYERLNDRIKMINSRIARPAVREYEYAQINEESYFDDIENRTINLRLLEGVQGMDRKIIISINEGCLKFKL